MQLSNIGTDHCLSKIIEYVEAQPTDEIPASGLIEKIIPCISENLFTLKKSYKIAVAVDMTYGKWPEALGNSFFIDSQWIVPDLIIMLKQRLQEVLTQHQFVDSVDAIDTFEELSALVVNRINLDRQNDYAFVVLGKMNNREDLYIYGKNDQLIHSYNVFLWHFRQKAYSIWSPMFNAVEKLEYMNFQLGSIFFTIIFFLFLIDGILIYSMMLNDVEERTYEFAMLRTLGFKNSSLVTLLVIQACF